MDVVVLFRYAWPHMNEVERQAASIEIQKMLQRHKASGAAGGAYYESALRELGEPAPAK
jgi:hypothetical protein